MEVKMFWNQVEVVFAWPCKCTNATEVFIWKWLILPRFFKQWIRRGWKGTWKYKSSLRHYSKGLQMNPFGFLKTKQYNRTLLQQFMQPMLYVFKENLSDRNAITKNWSLTSWSKTFALFLGLMRQNRTRTVYTNLKKKETVLGEKQ